MCPARRANGLSGPRVANSQCSCSTSGRRDIEAVPLADAHATVTGLSAKFVEVTKPLRWPIFRICPGAAPSGAGDASQVVGQLQARSRPALMQPKPSSNSPHLQPWRHRSRTGPALALYSKLTSLKSIATNS